MPCSTTHAPAAARRGCACLSTGSSSGRPKGLDVEKLAKVKKVLKKGLSVAKTVKLTGISLSSVKRYRKHLPALLTCMKARLPQRASRRFSARCYAKANSETPSPSTSRSPSAGHGVETVKAVKWRATPSLLSYYQRAFGYKKAPFAFLIGINLIFNVTHTSFTPVRPDIKV
ncbi:helix-turn-helix domain-containing protein [Hymenobacter sp. IS2118]|uniref:helix-turn-helix domain-containing protein n=1 Tax=Hymenobacter sp. IS2118 TaxID=1505605 RepID=UPI0021CD6185|nr:helix-turn-helix domain-containing protein [Hymenobacter sp. IS2118]